ncbi:hypothetical protein RG963_04115 [Methanosarcina sp. Z-7115]|uniref:Uncharacterized protein n=1 Tax=Methanosarcina baikalica TaxID=3073890 RepID=A0ABU2CZ18_9EURY|nr:hypothetical protein [Methanosarcina sp. Z-7115]MDR7664985.1 hypothetical protein [Methanosarcina sp. Z-7115]
MVNADLEICELVNGSEKLEHGFFLLVSGKSRTLSDSPTRLPGCRTRRIPENLLTLKY